jgi:hypothetical protein
MLRLIARMASLSLSSIMTLWCSTALADCYAVGAAGVVGTSGSGAVAHLGSVSQLMAGMAGKQGAYSQIYNEYEEFVAILLTNIYRSENGRQGLRRDHLGGNALLVYPLTNTKNFLTVWRSEIARLAAEMRALCDKVANVLCDFNPIFELYAAEGRFRPGGRAIR